MVYTYTCVGPIRGACGLQHVSADKCIQHIITDHNEQTKPGGLGFTDREPIGSDGAKFIIYTNFGNSPPVLKPWIDYAKLVDTVDKVDDLPNPNVVPI